MKFEIWSTKKYPMNEIAIDEAGNCYLFATSPIRRLEKKDLKPITEKAKYVREFGWRNPLERFYLDDNGEISEQIQTLEKRQ